MSVAILLWMVPRIIKNFKESFYLTAKKLFNYHINIFFKCKYDK